eukprot:ANDGO_03719.mRNA.1 hypothetical protein
MSVAARVVDCSSNTERLFVTFIHLDLGIGGAERWVVDSAVALQMRGHRVNILTSFHDPLRCFSETRDGTLKVTARGQWIPRSWFGKFYLLFSWLRMLYLTLLLITGKNGCRFSADPQSPSPTHSRRTSSSLNSSSSVSLATGLSSPRRKRPKATIRPNVVIVDQVSIIVPILRLAGFKVLFYCHYPDLLLADHSNRIKRIYRAPLDGLEAWTTAKADLVLVNSKYTLGIVKKTFPSLPQSKLKVLYPCINPQSVVTARTSALDLSDKTVFVSLNRFERKKNIMLAVDAFATLISQYQSHFQAASPTVKPVDVAKEPVTPPATGAEAALYADPTAVARASPGEKGASDTLKRTSAKFHLVLAGGYDPRIEENLQVVKELTERTKQYGIEKHVTFLLSCSEADRLYLFRNARGLLYTPENEHFGITPIEAMYCGCPVIACDSGGPLETVIHGETGYLVKPTKSAFSAAMASLIDPSAREEIHDVCREHVEKHFLIGAYADRLEAAVVNVHRGTVALSSSSSSSSSSLSSSSVFQAVGPSPHASLVGDPASSS